MFSFNFFCKESDGEDEEFGVEDEEDEEDMVQPLVGPLEEGGLGAGHQVIRFGQVQVPVFDL